LKEKATISVLLTWQEAWQGEIPDGVNFVQVPLTSTKSHICHHLKTDLIKKDQGESTCLLFFSKAAVIGFYDNWGAEPLPKNWKVAAVAAKTATELNNKGYSVDFVGSSTGMVLVKDLVRQNFSESYLMLSGNLGGEDVEDYFHENKVIFKKIKVYDNSEPEVAQGRIDEILEKIDLICLASPSAAERLLRFRSVQKMPRLLSIGPVTSKKIKKLGFEVSWQCPEPGYEVFLREIKNYLTK